MVRTTGIARQTPNSRNHEDTISFPLLNSGTWLGDGVFWPTPVMSAMGGRRTLARRCLHQLPFAESHVAEERNQRDPVGPGEYLLA